MSHPTLPATPPRIEDVVARWREFLGAAGKDRRLSSALLKAQPVSVYRDAVVLMLPAGEVYGRGVLRDRVALEGFLAAAIATWGAPLRPVVVDESGIVAPQTPPLTPAPPSHKTKEPATPPDDDNGGPRALPTHFKGITFRSRLEARWAVFFDHLGFRWEYEPEGFNLPSGRNYLPDFFLPEHRFDESEPGCWVEVKPSQLQFSKAMELARTTNRLLWMAVGNPNKSSWYWVPDPTARGCGEVVAGFLNDPRTAAAISAALSARFGT